MLSTHQYSNIQLNIKIVIIFSSYIEYAFKLYLKLYNVLLLIDASDITSPKKSIFIFSLCFNVIGISNNRYKKNTITN